MTFAMHMLTLSPLCDPADDIYWTMLALAAAVGVGIGFAYGRWVRGRSVSGGAFLGVAWWISALSLAFLIGAALISSLFYDALFPSVDMCGSTDRHVLPFTMALLTLPSVWIGTLLGARRAQP